VPSRAIDSSLGLAGKEQTKNKNVVSRVARGLSLVAGGGRSAPSRPAAERPIPSGLGEWSDLPEALRAIRPTLSELFTHPRDGGWLGFLLAQVGSAKPLLWVQERMAILEAGRIYPPGIGSFEIIPEIIHVTARDARSALWAMEEGLRCAALGAVIGELWGDPASLDFTATRRLAVAAERSGVPAWLVRLNGAANLSGARMRWRLASAPSLVHPFDPRAPGAAAWDAELFRARGHPPGRWSIVREARGQDPFRLVAAPGDRALAQDGRERRSA
jgi:protein ImuA